MVIPVATPEDQPLPPPHSATNSLTSSYRTSSQQEPISRFPELFSLTPTRNIIQDKWPLPPYLPQQSPHIRKRHNLHNYTIFMSTNGSYVVCSCVGVPPPTPQLLHSFVKNICFDQNYTQFFITFHYFSANTY